MALLKLPELDTRSVLDVVQENFQRVRLNTYAMRMIYIGEHTLSKEDIIEQFRATINAVNAGYCDINVNGLMLVYESYFVHIIEGSEDTIHRHLRFLFQRELDWIVEMNQEEEEATAAAKESMVEGLAPVVTEDAPPSVDDPKPERKMFRHLSMLMVYHSITTLQFDDWRAVTARPPSLVGKLDVYGPLSEHIEQLRICLDKITKFCLLAKADAHLSFEGLSANDPKMEALPEVALLDFLMQSNHILRLREVAHMHRRVDDYVFYFEEVWPLPTHFTPRYLYKLKIDGSFVEPLPVMPWELKKEDEDKGEEGDVMEQSASSSSD